MGWKVLKLDDNYFKALHEKLGAMVQEQQEAKKIKEFSPLLYEMLISMQGRIERLEGDNEELKRIVYELAGIYI